MSGVPNGRISTRRGAVLATLLRHVRCSRETAWGTRTHIRGRASLCRSAADLHAVLHRECDGDVAVGGIANVAEVVGHRGERDVIGDDERTWGEAGLEQTEDGKAHILPAIKEDETDRAVDV